MTAELWPCHRDGRPGVRNLGTDGWCPGCLASLYETFTPDVWRLAAVGVQDGPLRPDYGPGYADLRCPACAATWTALIGDTCWWCQRSRELMVGYQRELLLTPPDIAVGDARREAALHAWGERLGRGVRADIITRPEAIRAVEKAVKG